jgi:hypothetical protein
MPRTCTICNHDQKRAIDQAITKSTPYRNIAERYGLSLPTINRHVKACIPEALEAARSKDKADSGLLVEAEVQKVFGKLSKLIDACDEWLTDPTDPQKYCLDPRDHELQVIYLDEKDTDNNGNPKRKRENLRSLIARLEENQVQVLTIESKHADPRDLCVKAAGQIANQLALYGKLLGLFQRPKENDADVARREEREQQNRIWANEQLRLVMREKRMSEAKAKAWMKQHAPTTSEWLQ